MLRRVTEIGRRGYSKDSFDRAPLAGDSQSLEARKVRSIRSRVYQSCRRCYANFSVTMKQTENMALWIKKADAKQDGIADYVADTSGASARSPLEHGCQSYSCRAVERCPTPSLTEQFFARIALQIELRLCLHRPKK